jgi:cellulose synthase/poly-beta-1,6-N-acetylglucosamine synthase-like glycosyltransferase
MIWFFWLGVAFLTYTFAGYPLLLWLVSLYRKQPHQRGDIQATVSLIIPAHNEAGLLGKKLENSIQLLYPKDKLEIIVASDASGDNTAEIVSSFAASGVKLVELPERRGKHHAQMIARDVSQGDILVFTDASVLLEPQALHTLVSNFANSAVGCVSSVDHIVRSDRKGMGEQFYVLLEMGLRGLETRVGSMVSVSGSFFAARREVCGVWHPQQSSDFFIPLHTVAHGLRVIMDPECQAHYSVAALQHVELQRKVRTIVHGLDVVFTHVRMLNPWRYGFFSWQLVSHKLFRWLVPFGMLCLLVSSGFLWKRGTFYQLCLLLQVGIYGTAFLALISERLTRFKPLRLASFFLLGNAATLMAWAKFVSGEKFVAWNPTRR